MVDTQSSASAASADRRLRIALSTHPEVVVSIRRVTSDSRDPSRPQEILVRYTGPAKELIAVGVATPAMLTRAPARRRHLARVDSDGHRFQVTRHVGSRGGKPYTRFTVTREKPADVALAMPGVREAWARAPVDRRAEHDLSPQEPVSEPEPILEEDPQVELSKARNAAEWKRLFAGWLASQVGCITGGAHRLASDGRFRLSEEDATQLQRILREEWHDELQRVLDAALVLDTHSPQVTVPEGLADHTLH